jgi:hypothetical protein
MQILSKLFWNIAAAFHNSSSQRNDLQWWIASLSWLRTRKRCGMDNIKKRVLDRLDIQSYYSRELPGVKWRNGWGVTLCPFHGDKSPSFSVSEKTGRCKCFAGCFGGKSISVFDYHIARYGGSFTDALDALAAEAGVQRG